MTPNQYNPRVPIGDPIKAEPSLLTTELEIVLEVANAAVAANDERHRHNLQLWADRVARLPERGLPPASKALLQRAKKTLQRKAIRAYREAI